MIVIPNKNFTADSIRLVQLLNSTTKVNMLKACDKLDLYVSPNLKKDETARRIAQEMLDNPIEILSRLNKQELQMVDEFVKGLRSILWWKRTLVCKESLHAEVLLHSKP